MGRRSKNPSRIGRRQRRRRRREEKRGDALFEAISDYGRILPQRGICYERGGWWSYDQGWFWCGETKDLYRNKDGRWNFPKLHTVLRNGRALASLEEFLFECD